MGRWLFCCKHFCNIDTIWLNTCIYHLNAVFICLAVAFTLAFLCVCLILAYSFIHTSKVADADDSVRTMPLTNGSTHYFPGPNVNFKYNTDILQSKVFKDSVVEPWALCSKSRQLYLLILTSVNTENKY